MTWRQWTSQFVAALSLSALWGCGGIGGPFGEYDIPESPEVAAAPYPRLVDVPAAPPPGEYAPGIPDPAQGAQTFSDLATEAAVADVLASRVAGPVVRQDQQLAAAQRRADARAEALSGPVVEGAAPGPASPASVERARERAAALSAPVISKAEREAMLARARAPRP